MKEVVFEPGTWLPRLNEVENEVNEVDNELNEVENVVYHVVYTPNLVEVVFYLSNEALTRCFEHGEPRWEGHTHLTWVNEA